MNNYVSCSQKGAHLFALARPIVHDVPLCGSSMAFWEDSAMSKVAYHAGIQVRTMHT